MGVRKRGQMHKVQTVVPFGNYSGDAAGDVYEDLGPAKTIRARLNVTNINPPGRTAGTMPYMHVYIQDTFDEVNWHDLNGFHNVQSEGIRVVDITTPFTDRLRVRWHVPSPTAFYFSVDWFVQ